MEITSQFASQEFIRCAANPLYYLETYGKVFNAEKQMITALKCFDYQRKCVRAFHKNQNNIVLKSRQTGLSVITAAYVAWKLLFSVDEKILIIANDRNGAVRFLKTVKDFIYYTPAWLKPEEVKNNEQYIEFDNKCFAKAVAASKEAGRGESLTMLVLDETAFIENADTIWMGASMALSQTKGKCIMISTPNGTGNLYYRTWLASIKGENQFNRLEVHWTENPFSAKGLEKRLDENGKEFLWSPWYQEQIERLEYNKVKIAQELDLSFEGSKYLAIENEIIESYSKKIKEITVKGYYDFTKFGPKTEEESYTIFERFVSYKTPFWVWETPVPNAKYVVSADVARGDGSDYSTIQVINAETLEQAAEYQAKITADVFASVIQRVALDYNEAYVVVEANSFGLATCLELKNRLKYKRMFHSKSIKKMVEHYSRMKFEEGAEIPGFQTTSKTRPLIISCLTRYMRDKEIKLNSPRLIEEFKTFVMIGDKAQHEPGFNDDLIFALAIGLYIRDTEFQNVMLSQKLFTSMLGAIDFSQNVYSKPGLSNTNSSKKPSSGIGGIYTSNQEEASDDLSWLI